MSEFYTHVVQVGKVGKHPNADTLSITHVMGGYPCIIRTGDFQEGDKAVYISVDAIVPLTDPKFSFLDNPRIKAKKLRGIFSMGLLVPLDDSSWEVGRNVAAEYNIQKYEPAADFAGENAAHPNGLPSSMVYDLEGYRKHKDLLKNGEQVEITEKLHGANMRAYVDTKGDLHIGSHRQWKRNESNNIFWKVANKYNLAKLLPGVLVFGEVYGQVQDLKYGTSQGEVKFAVFDAYDTVTGAYLDSSQLDDFCAIHDLDRVPVLYRGPWKEELLSLAEGKTTIPKADHVREGIVIKSVTNRFDSTFGRVILKMVGEGYLLRKEK